MADFRFLSSFDVAVRKPTLGLGHCFQRWFSICDYRWIHLLPLNFLFFSTTHSFIHINNHLMSHRFFISALILIAIFIDQHLNFNISKINTFSASSDGTARLWSIETSEIAKEYIGHQKALTSLAFQDGTPWNNRSPSPHVLCCTSGHMLLRCKWQRHFSR